jgi:hypothetical protein
VIKQWIETDWKTTILAALTHVNYEDTASNLDTERILYRDLGRTPQKVGNHGKKRNYYDLWELQYETATETNINKLILEIEYLIANKLYPGKFYPMYTGGSEILCHLDLNEGTGNPADSSDNSYDFTLDGSYPPTWVTTGNPWQTNYLKFEGDTNPDAMANGTLLDSAVTALTYQVVIKLDSAHPQGALHLILKKFNGANGLADSNSLWVQDGGAARFRSLNELTDLFSIEGGFLPADRWVSIMATHGPRGAELYVDGLLVANDTTATTMIDGGTSEDFTFTTHTVAAYDYYLTRFQCCNVQRLPYDTIKLQGVRHVGTHQDKHTYKITLLGIQKGVWVGGNL